MEFTPELVEAVTRGVLAAMGKEHMNDGKHRALLIGDGDWNGLQGRYTLEGVREYLAAGSVEQYDFVLLDGVAPTLLADLALGRGNCPAAQAVSEALLMGKPVYLAAEGLIHRKYQRQANPRYFAMLEEYAAQLGRFGVCVDTRAVLARLLDDKEKDAPAGAPRKAAASGLLTAEAARKLCKDCGDVLCVAAGTVITPLARDVLREKKVRLEEQEEC